VSDPTSTFIALDMPGATLDDSAQGSFDAQHHTRDITVRVVLGQNLNTYSIASIQVAVSAVQSDAMLS
jgi:hypothetical protein